MNGIIENINNPFIVMVNLFDFFKVKQNYYSSYLNLSDVVFRLYKGLNKELSKKFCNSRFRMKVKVFHESLNFSFGYSTNDSLREILCYNIKNDYYVIPHDNLIRQVFDDVIKMGLGKSVENSLMNLHSIFPNLLGRKEPLGLEDINDIRHYPIFKGIVNHVKRYRDIVKGWDENVQTFRQKSKDLITLNIDSLFSKERNKTLELLNTGRIFTLGFNQINDTDEIYYGSSSARIESTYTSTGDLFEVIHEDYTMALKELDELDQGQYVPPKVRTPEEVADA